MDIVNNFNLITLQFKNFFLSFLNRVLFLATTAQIVSMIIKLIINIIKNKKIFFNIMTSYGGMPSSHTVFVMSYVFGIALDPKYGWTSPFFSMGIIFAAIVIVDAIKFRGTVDKINKSVKKIIESDPKYSNIDLPKDIAHKVSDVIVGIIFAFIYTVTFYLFFYNFFTN